MCWGYIIGKSSSSLLRVYSNPYLLLFVAALPDIDLLLGIVGIQHRTWTHSLLVWSVLFTPLFVIYRKRSIPYFIALVQHFLFGDAVVGSWNRPLWPISQFNFSLGYSLFSVENVVLEAAGLVIFLSIILATRKGRIHFFMNPNRRGLVVLPLMFVVGFVLFIFSHSWITDWLVGLGILRADRLLDTLPIAVQHPLFPDIVEMHLILIGILLVPLALAFFKMNENAATKEPQDSTHL